MRGKLAGLAYGFDANDLRVYGGSKSMIALLIETPAACSLFIHGEEGEFDLSGITGDKALDFKAGHLGITSGDPQQFRLIDASVWAGTLRAPAFGVDQSGIFRSCRKENPRGFYSLRIRLKAGTIDLR